MKNLLIVLNFSFILLFINACNYKEDGDLVFPDPLPPPVAKKQVEALVNGEKWEGTGRALYTKDAITLLCHSDKGDSLIIVVKSNKPGFYKLNNGSKNFARFISNGEYTTNSDLEGGSVEILGVDSVSHSIDAKFSFSATGSTGTISVVAGSASTVMYLHFDCYINGQYWASRIDNTYPQIDISSMNSVDGVSSSNIELYIYDLLSDSLQDGKTLLVKKKQVSCAYFPPSGDPLDAIDGKFDVKEFYSFEAKEYLNASFEFDFISANGKDTIKVRQGSFAIWKPIPR